MAGERPRKLLPSGHYSCNNAPSNRTRLYILALSSIDLISLESQASECLRMYVLGR